jgi:hypothetical protein
MGKSRTQLAGISVFLFLLFNVLSQPAWTATIQLPATGQTGCYNADGELVACSGSGQDADTKSGVVWPSPRFVDNGEYVTDKLTGLIWTQDAGTPTTGICTGGSKTWQEGLSYVACLNSISHLGYQDWRLPNRNELKSLLDLQNSDPALPSGHPFSNLQTDYYWTSSSVTGDLAWIIPLADGFEYAAPKTGYYYYVWPVRDAPDQPIASLSQTGQTTSYASGDDGDLRKGVSWEPTTRFFDNANGTISDTLTNLVWVKNADTPTVGVCTGGVKTWQEALDYVACLNTSGYQGHTDWRLPNRNELESLIDLQNSTADVALPTAHPFSSVQADYYWSSSSYAVFPDWAWAVSMYGGFVFYPGKFSDQDDAKYYTLPVRGGEPVPVLPAAASLPQTGQTSCYSVDGTVLESCAGTGQDAESRRGVAWPDPRFNDNGDQTVTDNLTGLIWTKNAGTPTVNSCAGGGMTWQGALDYVACLNSTGYLGHTDWRLPNRLELLSLIDLQQLSPALSTNHPFSSVKTYFYWSSSTNTQDARYAWGVYMGDGASYDNYKTYGGYYAWPVRGGQSGEAGASPISLPQTGQAICYSASGLEVACTGTGQDAEYKMGVVQPDPRFADNGDQTVTDNLTGLVWMKDAGTPSVGSCVGGAMTWQGALEYITCLNNYGYLGYTDWRLPNKNELSSLVDHQETSPVLAAAHPFSSVQLNSYWSSSSRTGIPSASAWYVNMSDGTVSNQSKTSGASYAWPVRGGQSSGVVQRLLSITVNGNGTVISDPLVIDCGISGGDNCSGRFYEYSRLTLMAVPETGSVFGGWTDGCTGSEATCQLSMVADKSVTATFTVMDNARVNGTSYGSLSAAYASAPSGSIILARDIQFTESLALDRGVNVSLLGGNSSDYSTRTAYTTLDGLLTIATGSLVVDRVIVK